uniref:Ribosome-inactivating protein n=1 Tax=Spiroplasma endosymbiont of Myrmica scabrinodis TaxID=2059445 RepID=A0A2H4YD46_9MOLU|nr:ribosome-inactivating protein [Spiroplasma endosymbiont of Myrmica scabrinodis]
MKKLLSLLSVLTISGTALPTVVANSPYDKKIEQTKLESNEINSLQTNNLEKLKRVKRNPSQEQKIIVTNELKLLKDFSRTTRLQSSFSQQLEVIISNLQESGIIWQIVTENSDSLLYGFNNRIRNDGLTVIVIPILIGGTKIEVVLTGHNLYVNGFILRDLNNEAHYYFCDGDDILIKSIMSNNPIYNISPANTHNLNFRADYNRLGRNQGTNYNTIQWETIFEDTNYLANLIQWRNITYNSNNHAVFAGDNAQARRAFRNLILITSESLRNYNIADRINRLSISRGNNYNSERWSVFNILASNWDDVSGTAWGTNRGGQVSRWRFINTRNGNENPLANSVIRIISSSTTSELMPICEEGYLTHRFPRNVKSKNVCSFEGKVKLETFREDL